MSLRWRLATGIAVVTAGLLVAGGVLLEELLASVAKRHFETTFDDSMRDFALSYMDAGGRARCEQDPTRFVFDGFRPPPRPGEPPPPPTIRPEGPPRNGSRPPPPAPPPEPASAADAQQAPPPGGRDTRIWAYRDDFTSANPRAPTPPPDLVAAMKDGRLSASHATESSGGPPEPGRPPPPSPGRRMLLRTAAHDGPCAVLFVERAGAEPPPPPFPKKTYLLAGAGFTAALALYGLLLALPTIRRVRRLAKEVRRSAASQYRDPVPVSGKDEIADLASEFNEAGRDVRAQLGLLEAREATLRAFVSNTAHDVAIPLTVLQGHLVSMRDAARVGRVLEPAAVREAVEEAHYIACLLQNLSAAAKLEASSQAFKKSPVDLSDLVERVVARHRPVADGAGVSLEYAVPLEPITASGDVTLLEQAVSNVVHNAIRYHRPAPATPTPDGSVPPRAASADDVADTVAENGRNVAVVLETAPRDATRFVLRVVDDGPGIPDDEMPHVLDRSFRGREARTRAPHGAGLGLHIANDVMKRHGFEMRLARSEPGGLEVTFSGPALSTTAGLD